MVVDFNGASLDAICANRDAAYVHSWRSLVDLSARNNQPLILKNFAWRTA